MIYQYSNAVFLRCEACAERVHCKQCGSELSELLNEQCKAKSIVDMENKTIRIETSMDEDDFLDLAEGLGIFL